VSCISSAQGVEPQDYYKLPEDMPHHHHFCAHSKVQRNFCRRDSKCLQLSQESTPYMPAKHIFAQSDKKRISIFDIVTKNQDDRECV